MGWGLIIWIAKGKEKLKEKGVTPNLAKKEFVWLPCCNWLRWLIWFVTPIKLTFSRNQNMKLHSEWEQKFEPVGGEGYRWDSDGSSCRDWVIEEEKCWMRRNNKTWVDWDCFEKLIPQLIKYEHKTSLDKNLRHLSNKIMVKLLKLKLISLIAIQLKSL